MLRRIIGRDAREQLQQRGSVPRLTIQAVLELSRETFGFLHASSTDVRRRGDARDRGVATRLPFRGPDGRESAGAAGALRAQAIPSRIAATNATNRGPVRRNRDGLSGSNRRSRRPRAISI